MKPSIEDFEAICFEDVDPKVYEIIEDGDWIDEGKYALKETIFKYDGKFYRASFDRSGNHFSGYDYYFEDMDTECPEVEKREVTVTQWVTK